MNKEKHCGSISFSSSQALHSVNKLRTEETAGKTALNETNGLIAMRRDEIEGLRGRLTPLLQTRSQKAQLKRGGRCPTREQDGTQQ